MPSAHALLSPSASKRWMTCPPSARLEAGEPDKGTSYTREGTIAHAMAEAILVHALCEGWQAWPIFDEVKPSLQQSFADPAYDGLLAEQFAEAKAEGLDPWPMAETVWDRYCLIVYNDYLAALREDACAVLLVEAELKLDDFIPEGFGSSDAVLIWDDKLAVYDLKYGQGVKVDANHNTQMMCYALGALRGPGECYPVHFVSMTIIQPRLSHVSSFTMEAELLDAWGRHELAPKARKAWDGEGQRVPGEHCRFCKVAARCRALAAYSEVLMKQAQDPALLTLDELSDLLHRLGTVSAFVSSVESYAMGRALAGEDVPGWKLVEGRGSRAITDPVKVAEALRGAGYKDEDIYQAPSLRTLTELEKLTGKKAWAAIAGDLVVRKAGKPTLVPADDPRPAYSPAESAAQDFADIS